jgi:uncharacterized damage-inducible protein DinB
MNHLEDLAPREFGKRHEGSGIGSVRRALIRIADSEEFWLLMLMGKEWRGWKYSDTRSLSDVRQRSRRVRRRVRKYIRSLTERQLTAPLELVFSETARMVTNPGLVLHHIFAHGFHHKGQIVAICRLMGRPAPDTDMDIAYK